MPRHRFAKPAGEGGARHRIKIADSLQSDPPQPLSGSRVEAQRFDRQRGEAGARVPRRQDHDALTRLRKAGQCPGSAERVGNGDTGGDALAIESGHQIGGEGGLPTPEMSRAGDLDPHPVRAIGRGPRAVAAAPFGQPAQRRHIFGGLGCGGGETGQKRERIGQRHSRGKAGGGSCRVDRGEQSPAGGLDHRGEWSILSRRGGIFPRDNILADRRIRSIGQRGNQR